MRSINIKFKRKKFDLSKAKSSTIFDKDCQLGEKIILKSKDKCTVMLAAPGEAMNVHNQNPPTDLTGEKYNFSIIGVVI